MEENAELEPGLVLGADLVVASDPLPVQEVRAVGPQGRGASAGRHASSFARLRGRGGGGLGVRGWVGLVGCGVVGFVGSAG